MPFTITSTSLEQVPVQVFGTATAADGSESRVDLRSITVDVTSGDSTVTVDGTSFTAEAGSVGDTVYTVTGTQREGADLTDTVTYTVTAAGEVATALGFEAGPAEPKRDLGALAGAGAHPDQELPGQPKPDQGLPGQPGRPTQLPAPTAKKR